VHDGAEGENEPAGWSLRPHDQATGRHGRTHVGAGSVTGQLVKWSDLGRALGLILRGPFSCHYGLDRLNPGIP